MDLEILKKKINTYRTAKGRLTKVPDELAYEILISWEQWTGPARGFYSAIGADYRKMAGVLGRAKKLKREGYNCSEDFKEIKIEAPILSTEESCKQLIVLKWDNNKIIKFPKVDQLIEFLKKVS